MKTSFGAKRLDRVAARNCFLVNQLATPGLGSLMAGEKISGLAQILIAVAGFALVGLWFVLTMFQTYNQITKDTPAKSYGFIGAAGALVFAAAWFWSLMTSISLLREAKKGESIAGENVPPRITNPPAKM